MVNYPPETIAKLLEIRKETQELLRQVESRIMEAPGDNPGETVYFPSTEGDVARFVGNAEYHLHLICNALAHIKRDHEESSPFDFPEFLEQEQKDKAKLVDTRKTDDFIIVKTPILRRAKAHFHYALASFVLPVVYEIAGMNLDGKELSKIIIYILTVYPENTSKNVIVDPDNIDTKTVNDVITSALRIDDNSVNVHIHIGSKITDRVPSGTYTIVTPRSEKIMGENELENLIFDQNFAS